MTLQTILDWESIAVRVGRRTPGKATPLEIAGFTLVTIAGLCLVAAALIALQIGSALLALPLMGSFPDWSRIALAWQLCEMATVASIYCGATGSGLVLSTRQLESRPHCGPSVVIECHVCGAESPAVRNRTRCPVCRN